MRHGVRLLGKPLRLILLLLLAASSAHALPYRQSGLRSGGGDGEDSFEAGEERGVDSLPPAPSDKLISDMNMHNEAFNYHYAFWNETDLDEASCSRLTQQLNSETAHSDSEAACVPHYICDRDPFRYPQWLVFTSCTTGPAGGCDPAHPNSLGGYRCFAHEEDILMLRYVTETVSRTTRSAVQTGGAADAGTEEEKPTTRENGEWQLWFVQVPSECKCYL